MHFGSCLFSVTLAVGCGLLASSSAAFAQETGAIQVAVVELPEAPQAQVSSAEMGNREMSDEQLKQQGKQRTDVFFSAYNVSYHSDAATLSAGQKLRFAFLGSTDPMAFGTAFAVAGYHEAANDDSGFGWGAEGYGKRAGAAFLDNFDSKMLGRGFFPVVLHQDPRYFRLGYGSYRHRILHAASSSILCRHDNSGKWEPNYSKVLGNIGSAAISDLYYPSDRSGIGFAFGEGFIDTAENGATAIFREFWPDISRKFFHRDPTHGLDAQIRAANKARRDAE